MSEANYLKRKTKALFSHAVTSAYAKRKCSHDAAHSLVLVIVHSDIETNKLASFKKGILYMGCNISQSL